MTEGDEEYIGRLATSSVVIGGGCEGGIFYGAVTADGRMIFMVGIVQTVSLCKQWQPLR